VEESGIIRIKRIYEQPSTEDVFRVLVDRLWPRGMSKEKAKIDLWLKEIAPSDDLRNWFSHEPMKWDGFKKKYENELGAKGELVQKIRQTEKEHGTVTLLYSAKDEKHNQAVVLIMFLKRV
jgi:uncharacterized protein YeaO (DUF488 family)